MMRRLMTIAMLAVCSWTATFASAAAAARQTLEGQIFSLGDQIRDAMMNDPRLKGQKLILGEFDGKVRAATSNYGQRIKQMLKEELSGLVQEDEAELSLEGGYFYVETTDPATPNAQVVLVKATILNERGKEVKSFEVEINDTDSIFKVLNLTSAAPPQVTRQEAAKDPMAQFQVNNQTAKQAKEKPTFDASGTRVSAHGAPQWALGILKKAKFDGPTTPVAPQNVKGLAFVPVGINEYYEIELVNNDNSDAVATLEVDGLDVANTFATDKDAAGKLIHWPGYFIPSGQTIVIRGWLHTINQSVKDNVFSFRVNELGQGAATALKTRGKVGVITVQFREACEPGGSLSGRSVGGETGKGEGLQEKLNAKPVQIGDNVLSTITIRYNRPE